MMKVTRKVPVGTCEELYRTAWYLLTLTHGRFAVSSSYLYLEQSILTTSYRLTPWSCLFCVFPETTWKQYTEDFNRLLTFWLFIAIFFCILESLLIANESTLWLSSRTLAHSMECSSYRNGYSHAESILWRWMKRYTKTLFLRRLSISMSIWNTFSEPRPHQNLTTIRHTVLLALRSDLCALATPSWTISLDIREENNSENLIRDAHILDSLSNSPIPASNSIIFPLMGEVRLETHCVFEVDQWIYHYGAKRRNPPRAFTFALLAAFLNITLQSRILS